MIKYYFLTTKRSFYLLGKAEKQGNILKYPYWLRKIIQWGRLMDKSNVRTNGRTSNILIKISEISLSSMI